MRRNTPAGLVALGAAAALALMALAPPPASAAAPPAAPPAAPVPASVAGPATVAPSAAGSYNGLALTPPMGFNDWAAYGCGINADLFTRTGDAIVAKGLDKLGYTYVNVDDCWMQKDRDAAGNLQTDTTRFPQGMKAVGDHLHAEGLKFGIYEDAGTNTCQGAAGSYGHFDQDAKLYASFGVDYLKLDYCYQPLSSYPGLSAADVAKIVYTQASDAIKNSGRPMVFSESAPAYYYDDATFWQIMQWIGSEGNLWRVGDDIADNWQSVLTNYQQTSLLRLAPYAGPGHWNDADMLEVGNAGLNLTEQQSQFTLWSELASPLLLSTDVTKLTGAPLAIVSNKDIIAVDQDKLGAQGTVVQTGGDYDVLTKPLANGDRAVVLFNKSDSAQTITTSSTTVGLAGKGDVLLKDLVSKKTTKSAGTIAANVPPHGTVMYRVSAAHGSSAAPSTVLDLAQRAFPGGKAVAVPVTLTDNGSQPLTKASLTLDAPAGWQVVPATAQLGKVKAGADATAVFQVTAPSPPPGRSSTALTATASYTAGGGKGGVGAQETVSYNLPYDNLAQAFNNIGVSDESAPAAGNFDGDGDSYSAQALAKAGATPGATISANGLTFSWPASASGGIPDNVAGGGLTVKQSGSGSALAFLGSEAGFDTGTVTVSYTDGSTSTGSLGFPNWCCSPTDAYGAEVALATDHRDTPSGPANQGTAYDVFSNTVPLTAGKQIATVTLPSQSSIHVFAMSVQP